MKVVYRRWPERYANCEDLQEAQGWGRVKKGRGTVLHMKLINTKRLLVDRPRQPKGLGVGKGRQGKG